MLEQISKKWLRWCQQQLTDDDLILELQSIKGNENEITDRFYKDLGFGTGGLRGIIGAGTNRMNIYTVGKATKGLANYLNVAGEKVSVAIAYDSRIKSEVFAKYAAEVFASNNINVYIYRELMPTPALSYAIRYLGCSGGIVITASHNPSKYNGYKVYGSDGGQITSIAAQDILSEINKVDIFNDVQILSFENALAEGKISYIDDDVITSYIASVSSQALCKRNLNKNISIIYTPLNGTGLHCVTRALKENGFTDIVVVKEQEAPDGNFPTCPYPNPEMREALDIGVQYAVKYKSDLLLATDPDCDRVGTAVRAGNKYVFLSGNEMGILLFDYICKLRFINRTMPENPVLVKTIVTTNLVKKIADDYGVKVIEVLTGFKYIGEQIGLLEVKGKEKQYIFGFEESYGYLSGTFVRDKDGVNASLLICEMCAFYKEHNKNLLDVLNTIYEKYGYYLDTLRSFAFEGVKGFAEMEEVMLRLRISPPKRFGTMSIIAVHDYKYSLTEYASGEKKTINLPKSNVIKFDLEGGNSLTIRPSGTEPKLKIYISANAKIKNDAMKIEKQIATVVEKLFY